MKKLAFKQIHLRYKIVFFIVLAISGLIVADLFPGKEKKNTESEAFAENGYVGDVSCKNCHSEEYKKWLTSDHYMAMQPANDSTVKGDFNDAVLNADGVQSRFFKRGNKFFINTQGQDGKNYDFEIKYTFGVKPLQQYLVAFPGGRMQVTRASWDTKSKKWFHQYKGQKIPAGDWLHWTGNAQNWNTTCADCHSTNLKKNYDVEKDVYNTTYSVINVSCEACHGAGKSHIDYIKTDYKKGEKVEGSKLELYKNVGQTALLNTCAPCHSRRTTVSNTLIPSSELLDNYVTDIPSTENFHADGQINDEDFIHTSFLQSKMFKAGVKCNNCHDSHTGKTLFINNTLCLQCHQKKYDDISHTFHSAAVAGSKCVDCHMPGKVYMGNDYRHDHSFRVPRPDLSAKFGTPNACNNCHKDQSAKWAAGYVEKWYGKIRKYHFSDDLIPGSKPGPEAQAHLLKLLENDVTPDIVKATAVQYIGNNPSPEGLKALLKNIGNPDAQTRYRTVRSLANFDPQSWMNSAAPLLNDPVRAVRVAAADMFLNVPPDRLPQGFGNALNAAKNDLMNFLYAQADFATGSLMFGDYYMRLNDNANAEKFYLRGLQKDSLLNLARLNLAVIYNLQGKNSLSLSTLQIAAKIEPQNARVFYNMALLYNEMGDKLKALNSFEKAFNLHSSDANLYYNYGLLLSQTDATKAERVLLRGLQVSPNENRLHYALAYLYLRQNQTEKALKHAWILKNTDPNNPEYRSIFDRLKL